MNLLFLLIVFLSSSVFGQDIAELYVSEGACPFEGCDYGSWHVKKITPVYSEQSKKSIIVGTLQPKSTVTAITGNVHIVPGVAKITGKPYHESSGVDLKKLVYILDYVGEGRTRIYHDGSFYITKIATSKEQYTQKHDQRRCWVKVLKEPVSVWWVKVKFDKKVGWVPIENGNISPIDKLS